MTHLVQLERGSSYTITLTSEQLSILHGLLVAGTLVERDPKNWIIAHPVIEGLPKVAKDLGLTIASVMNAIVDQLREHGKPVDDMEVPS